MIKKTVYIILGLLLLTTSPLVFSEKYTVQTMTNGGANTEYQQSSKGKKKLIDGTTAASKLRAKKSHSVSKQDETKLTVFLGLFAITMIIFLLRVLSNNK